MRRKKVQTRKEAIVIQSFIGSMFLILGALGLVGFVAILLGNNPFLSILVFGGFALFIGCYCFGSGIYLFYKMIKKIKENDTDYDNWL